MLIVIIRCKSLKSAYADRLKPYAHGALTLALLLLRAYTSAYSRKRRGAADDFVSILESALPDVHDKFRNTDIYRTGLDTGTVHAV